MGFFDKLKSYVGADKPTLTWIRVEKSIPITDTGVKWTINANAEKPMTIKSMTGELRAVYQNDEGVEKTEILATETDDGRHWSKEESPFPGILDAGKPWQSHGMVFMKERESEILQELFRERGKNRLRLMLYVTLDIVETAGLFDPHLEHEIDLYRPND